MDSTRRRWKGNEVGDLWLEEVDRVGTAAMVVDVGTVVTAGQRTGSLKRSEVSGSEGRMAMEAGAMNGEA